MDAAKDFIRQQQQRGGREALALREIVVQKPRHELPLPPSPLGLSNYDALDLEDEMDDEEENHEGGIIRTTSIYSDFNILNPSTSDETDYDYLDALDGITPEDLPDTPPEPPEETILEALREKERQGDSYFVRLGA
jgi:hypothetical protein